MTLRTVPRLLLPPRLRLFRVGVVRRLVERLFRCWVVGRRVVLPVLPRTIRPELVRVVLRGAGRWL